jgi:hypothetical protein
MKNFFLAGASLLLLSDAALAQNPLQQLQRLLPPQIQQQLPQPQQPQQYAYPYPYAQRDPKGECLGEFQRQQAVQAKWSAGPIRDPYLRNQANNELRAATQATNSCLQALYNRQAEEARQRSLQDQAARQAEMVRQANEARASQERIAAENRARTEAELAAKEREQNRWHEEREAARAKYRAEGKADNTVPECDDPKVIEVAVGLVKDNFAKVIDQASDYELTQQFVRGAQQTGVKLKGPNDVPNPKEIRERFLATFGDMKITFAQTEFGGIAQTSGRYLCHASTHSEWFDIFDRKQAQDGYVNYTIEVVDGRPLVGLVN